MGVLQDPDFYNQKSKIYRLKILFFGIDFLDGLPESAFGVLGRTSIMVLHIFISSVFDG
jgi:hypothetical protein